MAIELEVVECKECQGTGKLVYSNTGIENDCMYCNGFGKQTKPVPKEE